MRVLDPSSVRSASLRLGLTALFAIALSACAGYSPGDLKPGTPISEVTARMGPPTGEYAGPDGSRRYEFARGPFGKHTYMIDVNPQGQVTQWDQVLNDGNFDSLPVGLSEQELLYRIGHPAEILELPRRQEQVWSYRYQVYECIWFQASIDQPTKKVTSYGRGIDWKCDAGRGPRK